MKLVIFASPKGVHGISNDQEVKKFPERAEKYMVDEINAAITGAMQAGVTNILVRDWLTSGFSIRPELLHPSAMFVKGQDMPDSIFEHLEVPKVAFLIGMTAPYGVINSSSASTLDCPMQVTINNEVVGDADILTMVLAEYKIPVAMLTCDSTYGEQYKAKHPKTMVVFTKATQSYNLAAHVHPDLLIERTRRYAQNSIGRMSELVVPNLPEHYECLVRFAEPILPAIISCIPWLKVQPDGTISFYLSSMTQVLRLLKLFSYIYAKEK